MQSTKAPEGAAPLAGGGRLDGRAWLTLGAAAVLIAFWPLLLRSFGGDNVYATLGMYGVLILVAMMALRGKHRAADPPALRTRILLGLGVGVAMTVATYVAYHACVAFFPSLAPHVAGLYAATRAAHAGSALAWTVVVVGAEEILWRGPIFDVVPRGAPRTIIVALSLASYTAVQFGTGSGVVALAALVCGLIWTVERLLTKSMVAPLISHAIWTIAVIHLWPVTS